MTRVSNIPRRRFLLLAAGTTCGLAWSIPGCRSRDPATRILAEIDDRSSLRALGSIWLADNAIAVQQADGVASLIADLFAAPLPADAATLRLSLSDRIRQDYADGRTGHIGTWVLSHTEIRLCVLAATAPE